MWNAVEHMSSGGGIRNCQWLFLSPTQWRRSVYVHNSHRLFVSDDLARYLLCYVLLSTRSHVPDCGWILKIHKGHAILLAMTLVSQPLRLLVKSMYVSDVSQEKVLLLLTIYHPVSFQHAHKFLFKQLTKAFSANPSP